MKKAGCAPGAQRINGKCSKLFDRDHLFMVRTSGFMEEIPKDQQSVIFTLASTQISPETDFIVFDPGSKKRGLEDQGRTLKFGMPSLKHKVYAKLDDYGSKENLSKNVGHPVGTQYVLTLMIAEEY